MAWTTPRTWFAGEFVTVNFMNAQLRDNMNVLSTYYDTASSKLVGISAFANRKPLVVAVNTNIVSASNVSTGETDLITYSLPAGTLSVTGMAIRVTQWGTATNSANVKIVKSYFGASVGGFSGMITNSSASRWRAEYLVVRSGAAAQIGYWKWGCGPTNSADLTHGSMTVNTTQTLANAITVKVTGTGGASAEITALAQLTEVLYK